MQLFKPGRRILALSAAIAMLAATFPLAACSDDGSITLELAPATLNLAPGGSGTTTATIARQGGFTGPVLLARTGGPSLIVIAFTPLTIPNAGTNAVVSVTVGDAVPPGSYEITISAAGENTNTASQTLTIVVAAPG